MKKINSIFLGAILIFILSILVTAQNSVSKVILVTEVNYPDALVSSSVSEKLGIPILLTEKNQLPEETRSALEEFQPREIIVVGGPAVISEEVIQELEKEYNVTRLWGITRYGTSIELASHFWPEGAEEALLVENELEDKEGIIMGGAKNLANGNPILPIPEGKIPADVLNQLREMKVKRVRMIGTNITDEMQTNLNSMGIQIKEKVQERNEEKLQEKIKNKTLEKLHKNDTLVVVTVANFRHAISAPYVPQSRSLLISSEEEIQKAVEVVNQREIPKVKVAGKPDLAQKIAEKLENETEAEVDLVVKEAAQAVAQAAKLAQENREKFAKKSKEKHQRWETRIRAREEDMERNANRTLQKVRELIQDYNATQLRERLRKAKDVFNQGHYQEALQKAHQLRHELRKQKWEKIRNNWTAIREEIEEEVADLQEKVSQLTEINKEFGEIMRENMTVEERLETIEKFHGRKKEKVKELVEKAQEIGKGKGEEVGKWIKRAQKKAKEKGKECAEYTRNEKVEEHCATCGNGVCEPFERCTPSMITEKAATTDCGGLYCPQDCEEEESKRKPEKPGKPPETTITTPVETTSPSHKPEVPPGPPNKTGKP